MKKQSKFKTLFAIVMVFFMTGNVFAQTNTITIDAAFFAAMPPPNTGSVEINGTWTSADDFFDFVGTGNDGRWRQDQGGGVFETGRNGAGFVRFTTTQTATVSFNASSTGGSNTSAVSLWNAAGEAQTEKDDKKTVLGTGMVEFVFENLPPGTYRIVSNDVQEGNGHNRGVRVKSVTVEQQAAPTGPTLIGAWEITAETEPTTGNFALATEPLRAEFRTLAPGVTVRFRASALDANRFNIDTQGGRRILRANGGTDNSFVEIHGVPNGPFRIVVLAQNESSAFAINASNLIPQIGIGGAAGTAATTATGSVTGRATVETFTFDFDRVGTTGGDIASFLLMRDGNSTRTHGRLEVTEIRLYSLPAGGGEPPADPVSLYWRTTANVPAWVTGSMPMDLHRDTVTATNIVTTRTMLAEKDDYFTVALPEGDLTEFQRLVSTEFRWLNRSNAVVVVEESVNGTTGWTEVNRFANNASATGPSSTICIAPVDGQEDAILISGSTGSEGFTRFVNFQSLISPEARFVRYTMVQNSVEEAAVLVQAIGVRDLPHTENLLRTNFYGLQDLEGAANTGIANAQDLLGMDSTTVVAKIAQSHARMFNRDQPGSANIHPCTHLRIPERTNVRFGANEHTMTIILDEAIRQPGVVAVGVATHSNDPILMRFEYSTNGTTWTAFNDTAWVISSASIQTMYFEFPQVLEGITHIRTMRVGSGTGGTVTWFAFDLAIYQTPRPLSLDIGPVTYDDVALHFAPFVFVVPNDTRTITATDIDVVAAFPELVENVTTTQTFPIVFSKSNFPNDTVKIVYTATPSAEGIAAGFTAPVDHTVYIVKDVVQPTVVWQTVNGLGLAETGTIVAVWNKPVKETTVSTRVTANGVFANVPATLNATGDTLRIAYTAAHWVNDTMRLTIEPGAYEDFFLNTNEIIHLPVYTRDRIDPRVDSAFPAAGIQNAPMNGAIMVWFNEPIVIPTATQWGTVTLNGEPISGTNNNTGDRWFIENGTIMVIPYRELEAYKAYKLVIPKEVILDPAGNMLAQDFVLEFRTGGWLADLPPAELADVRALRHDFVQPSWITKLHPAAFNPNNLANARSFTGYNPNSQANITAGHAMNFGDGGFHFAAADHGFALHFANGVGELDLLFYANGGRVFTITNNRNNDTIIFNNRQSAAPNIGLFDTAGIVMDLIGPTIVYLHSSGTSYFLGVKATAAPLNDEAEFLTFSANDQNITVVYPAMSHELLFGADLKEIEVKFTVSHNAVVKVGGTAITSPHTLDFTEPVDFTVISEDEEVTSVYKVTLTVATPPTFATFEADFVEATIGSGTITAEVPADSDLKEVMVAFTTTPAEAVVRIDEDMITSPHTVDFTDPVTFTLQNPEGGARVTYVATIKKAASIQGRIMEFISFYPNPANDVLHVTANGIRQIEILDLLGQVVLRTSGSDNTETVNISNLRAGTYFLRVTTVEGAVSTGRFIKQ